MPYLIDGHNLIAALPDISLADPNDEAQLVLKLRGFAAAKRKRCTVVFDGGLPGGRSSLSTRGVTVIFAAEKHSDADSLIKRRISSLRDGKGWIVVSSDRDILAHARRQRVSTLTALQFAERLGRRPAPSAPAAGEEISPAISQEDVEEWLGIFGDR